MPVLATTSAVIIGRSLSEFLGGAYAVQWFFAAVSICGFGFALIFLPETHGKKLVDIQAHFSGEKSREKKLKKAKKNGVSNRKPKQTLETVQEAEKMMKESVFGHSRWNKNSSFHIFRCKRSQASIKKIYYHQTDKNGDPDEVKLDAEMEKFDLTRLRDDDSSRKNSKYSDQAYDSHRKKHKGSRKPSSMKRRDSSQENSLDKTVNSASSTATQSHQHYQQPRKTSLQETSG